MAQGVYIVSAVRTPIGKFGGGLADFSAADLGVVAVRGALERAFGEAPAPQEPRRGAAENIEELSHKIPRYSSTSNHGGRKTGHRVDQLILGNARAAGVGPNLARQVAWRSGLGDDVPAFTVNMACASSLRAIVLGWQQILLGEGDVILAAGTESMSRVPYLVEGRWGFRLGHQPLVDAMYRDGFLCPISNLVMGETAEVLAAQYKIPREEQDALAFESHQRAARATRECRFAAEIVPVERTNKKGVKARIEEDEHVRPDVTAGALAKLPPVFSKRGSVTAGNSSGITDGAAAVVLVSETKVRELNCKPLARIVDAAVVAVDPRIMGISPVPAAEKVFKRTAWKLEDYEAIELNEAFAAQVLACDRELQFDRARLNPNGGAIALGHPIGCTGARIVTTLVHQLRRAGTGSANGKRGLATLCVSGGLGMALAIETV